MPAPFDRATLAALDRTAEIDIETSRAAGGPVHRVTIWIVVDDAKVYVRSVRGPAGRWYRDLQANPDGAIHIGDRRVAMEALSVEDAATIARVSDALKSKYEQRWPGPLASMLRDEVLPTTLRLDPA